MSKRFVFFFFSHAMRRLNFLLLPCLFVFASCQGIRKLYAVNGALETCLNRQNASRKLNYPDQSEHPILIPYASWASAQILGQIFHILLTEGLGYSAVLMAGVELSSDPINFIAGCVNPDDPTCAERNPNLPGVHFSVETWLYGIDWANNMPFTIRPPIMSVYSYTTSEGWYVWNAVIAAGLGSKEHVPMNQYTSYNAEYFEPHLFFDPWTRMLDLIPEEYIVHCSEMSPNSLYDRFAADYVRATNNTETNCIHIT